MMHFRDKEIQVRKVGIGCRFQIYGGEYILAEIDYFMMILVNVHSGNRWGTSVKVENRSFLTEDEFLILLDGHPLDEVEMTYCPYSYHVGLR